MKGKDFLIHTSSHKCQAPHTTNWGPRNTDIELSSISLNSFLIFIVHLLFFYFLFFISLWMKCYETMAVLWNHMHGYLFCPLGTKYTKCNSRCEEYSSSWEEKLLSQPSFRKKYSYCFFSVPVRQADKKVDRYLQTDSSHFPPQDVCDLTSLLLFFFHLTYIAQWSALLIA